MLETQVRFPVVTEMKKKIGNLGFLALNSVKVACHYLLSNNIFLSLGVLVGNFKILRLVEIITSYAKTIEWYI